MFKYLDRVIRNGSTGEPSSKRFALVYGTIVFGIALLMLILAICLGREVTYLAIWAVSLPLSLLAGVSYSTVEIAKIKNPMSLTNASTHDPDKQSE